MIYAGVNSTSYQQAQAHLKTLAEIDVSDKQIRRRCQAIGSARVQERDAAVAAYQQLPLTERKGVPDGVTAPEVAVVGVDGGRLQIFERCVSATTRTKGVAAEEIHDDVAIPEPETKAKKPMYWREDKIGLLMTMSSKRHEVDPCPEIPASFVNPHWIPELAKEMSKRAPTKEAERSQKTDAVAPPTSPSEPPPAVPTEWEPPEVLVRQLAATRRPWEAFGPIVAERAWSAGFFGASRKAFLADGAETNWTLWRGYFSSFVPILDFIHALSYVFHSAVAGRSFEAGWEVYNRWIRWVWLGEMEKVIVELAQRQVELGPPADDASATHPASVVARALGYLQNHKDRMRYAAYRKEGLPIVSSYVESAVKQFNHRVKGTEKFWREGGAEEMLQLRADYLSDDAPMTDFWRNRQTSASGQANYQTAA